MDNCKFCRIDFFSYDENGHRLTKIDTLFCSRKCKDDYFNGKRKAQRAGDTIIKKILELKELSKKHEEFATICDRFLESISESIVTNQATSFSKCRKCGQLTFDSKPSNCPFCGSYNWVKKLNE